MVLTPALALPFTIILGLILGSFTSALSWRVARGEGWVNGRSRCPHCGAELGVRDLIPIFSWLALGGKCRRCRAAIGARYPLTELAILLGCLIIYATWGFDVPALLGMLALPFLATLLLVDLEQMILPDSMTVIFALIGLCFAGVMSVNAGSVNFVLSHLAGALLYAAIIWLTGWTLTRALKKDALGFGDVKFFAAAGLWLGLGWLPYFLLLAGVAGLIHGGILRLITGKPEFPFGPALITAFFACFLLYGTGVKLLIP